MERLIIEFESKEKRMHFMGWLSDGGGSAMKRWHFDNCKQKEVS